MSQSGPGPVSAVAEAVGAGRVRAVTVVRAALERIERLDGPIGSVVALRADEALRDAAALDARLTAGAPPGPLAGVPVLVKDLEDVAGMPTRQGSRLFEDAPPASEDGLIPGRLRAAGAIVVGKSNLPEFATEGFCDNLVSGLTRNPWAPEWSPGGSSGGSAAAMAAGLVPTATGTDGGGSVRIPAAFCGLLGLKPTLGLIAAWPPADWIDLSTFGPMASTSADLRRLLAVEAGPVAGDPTALPAFGVESVLAGTDDMPPPTRLYAAHRTSDLGPLPAGIVASFGSAVAAMAEMLGLDVTWLEPGSIFTAGDPDLDWFVLATAEHVSALGRARMIEGLPRMHPATRPFMEAGLDGGIDDYLAARRRRFSYVRRMDELLGDAALLLTPTVAVDGWYADGRLTADGTPGMLPPEVYSTAVQNMTGHPAITLPAGCSSNGVPFGLQATAPRYRDGLLLELAARWEAAHPWPRVAPGYEPFEAILG